MEPLRPPRCHLPPEEAQSQDHTYVSVGVCVAREETLLQTSSLNPYFTHLSSLV